MANGYGKVVTRNKRAEAEKSQLKGYRAKASPKAWLAKKDAALADWKAKKAPKKVVKAKVKKATKTKAKAKAPAKKKRK